MKSEHRPIKFVDRLEGNNHIVLLYDNPKYADLVIARYLLSGLKKGQSCIFFTSDEPKAVEKQLSTQGINIDLFKHANSLRIFHIARQDTDEQDAFNIL